MAVLYLRLHILGERVDHHEMFFLETLATLQISSQRSRKNACKRHLEKISTEGDRILKMPRRKERGMMRQLNSRDHIVMYNVLHFKCSYVSPTLL